MRNSYRSRSARCLGRYATYVMEATAGRQELYTDGSLPGREDFYFVQK